MHNEAYATTPFFSNYSLQALAPYTTQCVGIDISENMVAAYNSRAEYQVRSKSGRLRPFRRVPSSCLPFPLPRSEQLKPPILLHPCVLTQILPKTARNFGPRRLASQTCPLKNQNPITETNKPARAQGLSPDEMHAVVGDLAAADGPHPADLLVADPRLFDVATVGGGLHHFADPELAAERLARRLRPGGVLLVWDFAPHGPHATAHFRGSHTVLHHGLSEDRVRALFERAGVGEGFELVVLGSGVSPGHGHSHGHGHGHDGHGHDGHDGEPMRRQVFLARGQKAA